MANIKLKDLLNEIGVRNPWLKEQDDTPTVDIKELVNTINNYGSLGENIYGKGSLKEVAETLSSIAEGAAQHTLSETEEVSEMMFKEDDGYKAFFQKAMKKFGISSPSQLKPEDKKDFYDYVDRNYKAEKETD